MMIILLLLLIFTFLLRTYIPGDVQCANYLTSIISYYPIISQGSCPKALKSSKA